MITILKSGGYSTFRYNLDGLGEVWALYNEDDRLSVVKSMKTGLFVEPFYVELSEGLNYAMALTGRQWLDNFFNLSTSRL
jgi:hypothetical protein